MNDSIYSKQKNSFAYHEFLLLSNRLDVTTILICTENMLWSVCTSVQKLLNPHEYIDDKIFKIHTHCNNLFTTLVILTSPLSELYQ